MESRAVSISAKAATSSGNSDSTEPGALDSSSQSSGQKIGQPTPGEPSVHPWLSRGRFLPIAEVSLILYAATAALSVALSQILLIPMVIYWLAVLLLAPGEERREISEIFSSSRSLIDPTFAWFAICLISGAWGADPGHSFSEAMKGSVFLLFPFAVSSVVAWKGREAHGTAAFCRRLLSALLLGQSLAGLHTLLTLGAGLPIPEKIPGAVTESGQLVLVLPLILAQLLLLVRGKYRMPGSDVFSSFLPALVCCVFIVFCWPFAGVKFSQGSLLNKIAMGLSLLSIATLTFKAIPQVKKLSLYLKKDVEIPRGISLRLFSIATVLLLSAFLFNLKRGPWIAVFLEILFLGVLFSRRLAIWSLIVGLGALVLLSPVRNRLLDSADDFSIQGGRQNMWSMGSDLVASMPLGMGFGNSKLMRKLDPTLPERHRHMHNNILQVTVETGWLGLGIYLWWMGSAIFLGVKNWRRVRRAQEPQNAFLAMILITSSLALLGWQCAGLVEYNFGDAEIRLIAFLYIGLILGISRILGTQNSPSPHTSMAARSESPHF